MNVPAYRNTPNFERGKKFPEGSAAAQYVASRSLIGPNEKASTGPQTFFNRREFKGTGLAAEQIPVQRIDARQAVLEYRLTDLMKTRLQKTTLPGPLVTTVPHFLSVNAIRRITRCVPDIGIRSRESLTGTDTLKDGEIVDTFIESFEYNSKKAHKHIATTTTQSRDLGRMTDQDILDNNIHNVPLSMKPVRLGQGGAGQLRAQVVNMLEEVQRDCVSRLKAKLVDKHSNVQVFQKALEPPTSEAGFPKTKMRRSEVNLPNVRPTLYRAQAFDNEEQAPIKLSNPFGARTQGINSIKRPSQYQMSTGQVSGFLPMGGDNELFENQ